MRPSLALPNVLGMFAALAVFSACGGASSVPQSGTGNRLVTENRTTQNAPPPPAQMLIAANTNNGALWYWPIVAHGGGKNPQTLAKGLGLGQAVGMATDGQELAVTNSTEILLYDVNTKKASSLTDPDGTPIDVAIGKDHSIYALNLQNHTTNVDMYPGGSPNPKKLSCAQMTEGEYVAVDDQGNVFINGYETNTTGVVEIPSGGKSCVPLNLRHEIGYVAGLVFDPKTGDLLVLENPDLCAGGYEGRLVIYPKPYRAKTGIERNLQGVCMGGMHLNSASNALFAGDTTVDEGTRYIREYTYPAAVPKGTYTGGQLGGFTTLPSTLPN